MLVHSRSYNCDRCGKRFSRQDALTTHQQGRGSGINRKSITVGCLMRELMFSSGEKSTEEQINAVEKETIKHKKQTVRECSQPETDNSPVREELSEDTGDATVKEETIVVTVHLEESLDAENS